MVRRRRDVPVPLLAMAGAGRRWRLIVLGATTLAVAAIAGTARLEPRYSGPVTDHFDGRRFSNAAPFDERGLVDVARWLIGREPGRWRDAGDARFAVPPRSVDGGPRITFVNHATVLLQLGGQNLLTDPVWSQRASPVPFAGPRRFRQPGIRFGDLPPVHAVLISHNHFDHMDLDALERLAAGHPARFYVPLGNAVYLQRRGIVDVVELDWWQSVALGELTLHAVPAQHWSRRGLTDRNRALWSGWVIEAPQGRLYFAGDTGFGPHFEHIRERFGPPDLALLPIGAYSPRWFMAPQHIDPAEAVQAHRMLGAGSSMAVHFGTFPLGDDGQSDAPLDLRSALRRAGLAEETFWIPLNGEHRSFAF